HHSLYPYTPAYLSLFFYPSVHPSSLHSFPTRRSSDLVLSRCGNLAEATGAVACGAAPARTRAPGARAGLTSAATQRGQLRASTRGSCRVARHLNACPHPRSVRPPMPSPFPDRLAQGPLLADGAMGT